MDGTHYATIGMDVSDRKAQVCVMAEDGKSPKIAMETVRPEAGVLLMLGVGLSPSDTSDCSAL